jgi:phosphoenolpyruvate carboxykinase (diphosphate)
VSLLLRPLVVPEVRGFTRAKRLETRFFAPGSLVANLDFVETIFGNAGDPFLPDHDAALDVEGWTGHTGCVILAPHLVNVPKILLGLPHRDLATPRQRRDGMCWTSEDERYNGGTAFKLCARDRRGVMVTLIADNYFGYCKKEVKTQISFAANLHGLAEEEHAGGALVYPSYDLGDEFSGSEHVRSRGHTFADLPEVLGRDFVPQPEGHGADRLYPDILYVPENVHFDLRTLSVTWTEADGTAKRLPLLAGRTYVRPSGYRVELRQPAGHRSWHLVGTVAEPTLCHKPCTVSGGGKSEISKAITDAILPGSVFVADFERDFDRVTELLARDYGDRFRDPAKRDRDRRPILSPARSLGSVIKLLTPAEQVYSDEYNTWLNSIPQYVKELVYVVKRHYRSEWGDDWRRRFSVDVIDGRPANELKCEGRRLNANYLRLGFEADGTWRVFGLREDFHPAAKVQMEDDITASVVVPARALEHLNPAYDQPAYKFVRNCESHLFQRPDDAVHPGYDKQTERDLAGPRNFISNFAPLTAADARAIRDDAVRYDKYTYPMQELIAAAADERPGPPFFVCSSHPRIVEGKPSKNPRYLQRRPDLADPRSAYLGNVATRLHRRIPAGAPLHTPVNAVVPGRRNNPPEASVRSLAVYNPIHHMELPELFMEFISSMTGKSPSTTGAGSEGALTKGPFNALPAIIDLNAALVSYLLTAQPAFITAAGYVGPHGRVDHDVSLLVPEVWCRMTPEERSPRFLLEHGYLEKCEDFTHEGKTVRASLLGYRINAKFARVFFGRVFNHPHLVFTPAMLRPETQDLAVFVDGLENICTTHRHVAEHYFNDGTIALACPPLRALLEIMARGRTADGHDLESPEVRGLFTREALLASDWYRARLEAKCDQEKVMWAHHIRSVELLLDQDEFADVAARLNLAERLKTAHAALARVETPAYLESLVGTLGAQPL